MLVLQALSEETKTLAISQEAKTAHMRALVSTVSNHIFDRENIGFLLMTVLELLTETCLNML